MGEGVKGGAFRGVNVCEGVVEDDGCGDRGWRRPLLEDGAVVGGEHKQQLVQHRERSLSPGRPLKRPGPWVGDNKPVFRLAFPQLCGFTKWQGVWTEISPLLIITRQLLSQVANLPSLTVARPRSHLPESV